MRLLTRFLSNALSIRDLSGIFQPLGSLTQALATGYKMPDGRDLNQIFASISNGAQIGQSKSVELQLAVISPLTTWFTTGMAIILLLAAVVQSVRRVKRRHE